MTDLCPLYEGSSIMRLNDKKIFLQVAQELKLWILVRRTNPASLQYIGRASYAPKSIDCKVKTADRNVGPSLLAGLVVDPTAQPLAGICWIVCQEFRTHKD